MLKTDRTSQSEASADQNLTKNWRDYLKELNLITSNFYAETIIIIESSSQCTRIIDSFNRQIELTQQPRLYTITPTDIGNLINGKVSSKNLKTVGKILKKVSVDAKKEIKSNNGVVSVELMAILVKLQMVIIRDRYLSIKENHQELQKALKEEEDIMKRCAEEEKPKKSKKSDKSECEDIQNKTLESATIRKRIKALKLPEIFVEPLEGIDLYFVINKIYDFTLLHELGNIWVHVFGLIDFGAKDGWVEDDAILKFWKASETTALPPQTCYLRYYPKIPSPDFPEESSLVYDDLVRICYNLSELTSLYQVYLLRLSILDVKTDKTVKLRGMRTYKEILGKVPLEVQNVPLVLSALIEEVVKRCDKTARTTFDPPRRKKLPKNQVVLSRSKIVQYGNVLDYQLSHLRYYEAAKKINLLALKATQPNLFAEQPEDNQEAVIAYKYLFHKWASGLDVPINRLKHYIESLVMVHWSFQKPFISTVLPKQTLKDLFFLPTKTYNRDFDNIPEVFFREEVLPMVANANDAPVVPDFQHWEKYDSESLLQVLNVAYSDVKDFEYKYFAPHDTILLRFRCQPRTDQGRYLIRTVVPFRDFCAHIARGEMDWLCEKSWRYWKEQESTVDAPLEAYNLSEQYYEISDKSFEYFSVEGIRVGLERRKFPEKVENCEVKVGVQDHLMVFHGVVRKSLDFRPLTFHLQLSNGTIMGFGPPKLPKEMVPCQDKCIVSDTVLEPRGHVASSLKSSKTYRICSSRLHKFSYVKRVKTISSINTQKVPSRAPSRKVVIRKILPVLPQNQRVHTLDYDFKTTLPSGLKIELLQGPKPVPFHVKQSYTSPRKDLMVKNEKYRCFLKGNVISFLMDGRVVVKSYDRVVQTLQYGYFSLNTNRGRGKWWKHLIGRVWRGSTKLRMRNEKNVAKISKMIYRKIRKLPVIKASIVDEKGLLMVGRVGKQPEEVRRYTETVFKGYAKGETFVQREDGTSWFLDNQGRATTQFEDKTRITTWGTVINENFYMCDSEEEEFREFPWGESPQCTEEELKFTKAYDYSCYSDRTKVSCSIEDSLEPFVVYGLNYRYAHPNYMPVTDYCLDEVVTIKMPDGVEVEVKKRGGFGVTLQPNLTIDIDKEAVSLYERSCETCNSYTEMKINVKPFHSLSRGKPRGPFLELVDKQNTIIQIDFLGNLTQSECPVGESVYSQCICPKKSMDRFFVLNRDLSGIELFSHPVSTRFIHTLTNFKPQQSEPTTENTITIIQNLYKNYSEHFMMLYDLPLLGITTDQDDDDALRRTYDYHKELLPLRTPIVVYERNIHHLYRQESLLPEDLSNFLIVPGHDQLKPDASLVKLIRDNSPDVPLPRLEPELHPIKPRIVPVSTPENSLKTSILTTDMEIFEDKLDQGDVFEETWVNVGIGESSVVSEVTEVCGEYYPGEKLEITSSLSK